MEEIKAKYAEFEVNVAYWCMYVSCVAGHMRVGAHLVMADFISNGSSSIDNYDIGSFFLTAADWASHLANVDLLITDVIDMTAEASMPSQGGWQGADPRVTEPSGGKAPH